MKAIELYNTTKSTLEQMANLYGVTDLDRYPIMMKAVAGMNWIHQAFHVLLHRWLFMHLTQR